MNSFINLIKTSFVSAVLVAGILGIMGQTPSVDSANLGYIGDIRCSARDDATKGRWLVADGRTVGSIGSVADLRGEDYRVIFDAIKTEGWGNAGTEVFDNNESVTLPDLRERFMLMADGTNYVHGSTTTKNITSVSVDALAETNIPQHNHEDPSFAGQTGNNDVSHSHSTDAHKDQGVGTAHGGGTIGQASAVNGNNTVNHQHALTNFGQATPDAPTVNSGSATATMSRAVVTCFIRY